MILETNPFQEAGQVDDVSLFIDAGARLEEVSKWLETTAADEESHRGPTCDIYALDPADQETVFWSGPATYLVEGILSGGGKFGFNWIGAPVAPPAIFGIHIPENHRLCMELTPDPPFPIRMKLKLSNNSTVWSNYAE